MKFLLYLGHPAQFHLFKFVIAELLKKEHEVKVLIKSKDILEYLCKKNNFEYENILPYERKENTFAIITSLIKRYHSILEISKKFKPDLLIGSDVTLPYVGKSIKRPSIIFSEDDIHVIPSFALLAYPLVTNIISPETCGNGYWVYKRIPYSGYHKLAYLHPRWFSPNIKNSLCGNNSYFILRFSSLTAYHDKNKNGISNEIAVRIINILSKYGRVYISSERNLPEEFQQYKIDIDPSNIHDALYYSQLFIGDSQSMAVESAMLGVPSIRFNDFAGEIGVLEELEHKYGLTYGIKTNQQEKLFNTINKLLSNINLKKEFQIKREKMLMDKIDVTKFFIWFIENFPKSARIIKKNPEYQYNFR